MAIHFPTNLKTTNLFIFIMCEHLGTVVSTIEGPSPSKISFVVNNGKVHKGCLLYTSDAADDLLCVDLGGRRIITKQKMKLYS